jgi:hypothetical protein
MRWGRARGNAKFKMQNSKRGRGRMLKVKSSRLKMGRG